jgi:hypothetical protein
MLRKDWEVMMFGIIHLLLLRGLCMDMQGFLTIARFVI